MSSEAKKKPPEDNADDAFDPNAEYDDEGNIITTSETAQTTAPTPAPVATSEDEFDPNAEYDDQGNIITPEGTAAAPASEDDFDPNAEYDDQGNIITPGAAASGGADDFDPNAEYDDEGNIITPGAAPAASGGADDFDPNAEYDDQGNIITPCAAASGGADDFDPNAEYDDQGNIITPGAAASGGADDFDPNAEYDDQGNIITPGSGAAPAAPKDDIPFDTKPYDVAPMVQIVCNKEDFDLKLLGHMISMGYNCEFLTDPMLAMGSFVLSPFDFVFLEVDDKAGGAAKFLKKIKAKGTKFGVVTKSRDAGIASLAQSSGAAFFEQLPLSKMRLGVVMAKACSVQEFHQQKAQEAAAAAGAAAPAQDPNAPPQLAPVGGQQQGQGMPQSNEPTSFNYGKPGQGGAAGQGNQQTPMGGSQGTSFNYGGGAQNPGQAPVGGQQGGAGGYAPVGGGQPGYGGGGQAGGAPQGNYNYGGAGQGTGGAPGGLPSVADQLKKMQELKTQQQQQQATLNSQLQNLPQVEQQQAALPEAQAAAQMQQIVQPLPPAPIAYPSEDAVKDHFADMGETLNKRAQLLQQKLQMRQNAIAQGQVPPEGMARAQNEVGLLQNLLTQQQGQIQGLKNAEAAEQQRYQQQRAASGQAPVAHAIDGAPAGQSAAMSQRKMIQQQIQQRQQQLAAQRQQQQAALAAAQTEPERQNIQQSLAQLDQQENQLQQEQAQLAQAPVEGVPGAAAAPPVEEAPAAAATPATPEGPKKSKSGKFIGPEVAPTEPCTISAEDYQTLWKAFQEEEEASWDAPRLRAKFQQLGKAYGDARVSLVAFFPDGDFSLCILDTEKTVDEEYGLHTARIFDEEIVSYMHENLLVITEEEDQSDYIFEKKMNASIFVVPIDSYQVIQFAVVVVENKMKLEENTVKRDINVRFKFPDYLNKILVGKAFLLNNYRKQQKANSGF